MSHGAPPPESPAPPILTARRGSALVVTLNRPDVKNALSAELVAALQAALAKAAKDAGVRGIVLAGAGGDFCAGADLSELQEAVKKTRAQNLASSRRLADLFKAMHLHPKPLVAAVRGFALAGGAGLACACDHVIASGDARFGFTEARIGFVPAIVSRFLIDRVGPRAARDLLLTARRVDSSEALALGLTDAVVPLSGHAPDASELVSAACLWLEQLKPCSPASIAATKRLLADLTGKTLPAALTLAAALNAKVRASDDFREGVAAFLEKRKPRWLAES